MLWNSINENLSLHQRRLLSNEQRGKEYINIIYLKWEIRFFRVRRKKKGERERETAPTRRMSVGPTYLSEPPLLELNIRNTVNIHILRLYLLNTFLRRLLLLIRRLLRRRRRLRRRWRLLLLLVTLPAWELMIIFSGFYTEKLWSFPCSSFPYFIFAKWWGKLRLFLQPSGSITNSEVSKKPTYNPMNHPSGWYGRIFCSAFNFGWLSC